MEKILHYLWEHKILPLRPLRTTDGKAVEVINPGLPNYDAGPDFSGAHVRIDGVLWVGDVEIHEKTSDWFHHHHDKDPRYQNIILHVVLKDDVELSLSSSSSSSSSHSSLVSGLSTLIIEVPEYILDNYEELLRSREMPRCKDVVKKIYKSGAQRRMEVHNWMSALEVERLEQKTKHIKELCEHFNNDWENVLFIVLARYFGMGVNSNAFETWAMSFPLHIINKFRNDIFQLSAFFLGQAGLLNPNFNLHLNPNLNPNLNLNPNSDLADQRLGDLDSLRREYDYLRKLYSTEPINPICWKYLRTRPKNFPHVRLLQLAQFYHTETFNMSTLLSALEGEGSKVQGLKGSSEQKQIIEYYYKLLELPVTKATKDVILINCVVPMLFAYGKYRNIPRYCERALDLLESIKPENNRITRAWKEADIVCENAADSQAIIQLTREYCNRHDCLRCRFGHEFISRHPDFLCEGEE